MIDDALREELSALLDGALPEERALELRRRIEKDPELRRAHEDLERAVNAVRALPRSRAPAELRARIRGSLGERRAPARIFRLGALAAAAAVLLAAVLYLRREPTAHHEAAEGPARERLKDDALGKEQLPGFQQAHDRAEIEEGGKLGAREDGAGVESQLGAAAPKDAAKRGTARAKEEASDLLTAVEKTHEIPEPDRKAYLRQVAALGPEGAREHVLAVFPDDVARGDKALDQRDEATPVLATIQLADREEADLVRRILDAAPRPEARAAAATIEQDAKDQMTTEILGTPEDLARLGRWLELFDLARPAATRSKSIVFGEAKAKAKADEKEPKVRTAVVRLKYGKPPEPQPEAPAKGK